MKITTSDCVVYLVFERKERGYPRVRLANATTKQPALKAGQRAIRIIARLPDAMFEPQGIPSATITVPEAAFSEPIPEVEVLPFKNSITFTISGEMLTEEQARDIAQKAFDTTKRHQ